MRDKNKKLSRTALACVFLLVATFAGCLNTQMIAVAVTNTSTEKISRIVIDYPEATFGINSLEPGKSFQYKIKATATGPLRISFFNARGVNRTVQGPVLHKNEEGAIEIKLTQEDARVSTGLR